MKWHKKYQIDLEKTHQLNKEGMTLIELAEMYHIPRTTINRYLTDQGYEVYKHNNKSISNWKTSLRQRDVYVCRNAWKRALIFKFEHKCAFCGYHKIVEAHHIIPAVDGGLTSIKNGILLCPTHHAEAHAGILEINLALVKRDELLENPEKDNQQLSHECNCKNTARVMDSPTTRVKAKAITTPRAS